MKKIVLTKKKTIIGSLALVLVIVGSSFSVWALSTNKGVIMTAPEKAVVWEPAIATQNGEYIYFQYSNSYKLEKLPATPSDPENYELTANTNFEKHVAVIVHKLDNTGLNGFTGYTSRNSRTDLYDKQDVMVGQEPAVEFVKKDQTERTVFILRGNYVAVFAFVTTSRYDDIDTEITTMLNSFNWKQ